MDAALLERIRGQGSVPATLPILSAGRVRVADLVAPRARVSQRAGTLLAAVRRVEWETGLATLRHVDSRNRPLNRRPGPIMHSKRHQKEWLIGETEGLRNPTKRADRPVEGSLVYKPSILW